MELISNMANLIPTPRHRDMILEHLNNLKYGIQGSSLRMRKRKLLTVEAAINYVQVIIRAGTLRDFQEARDLYNVMRSHILLLFPRRRKLVGGYFTKFETAIVCIYALLRRTVRNATRLHIFFFLFLNGRLNN